MEEGSLLSKSCNFRDIIRLDMRLYILGLILVFLLPGTSGEVTEKKEEEIFEFPLSCREVIYETATDPLSCAKVRSK